MGTDGTFNPTATYVEAQYPQIGPVTSPHRVTGSSDPIGVSSKMMRRPYGIPTSTGKFISVEQAGEVVYTEEHINKQPMVP